jgi:hypothetical protein
MLPGLALALLLLAGPGCSLGRLVVQVPTPTLAPTKTPRPTFTFTPDWTPTLLPTLTATHTPVPAADTPTPEAAQMAEAPATEEAPPIDTPPPPPPSNTPVPQAPADTPTPEPPTATPEPQFAFACILFTHPTGNSQYTYITGSVHKWVDKSMGNAAAQEGYVLVINSPAGEYKSTVSGPGTTDSRGPGLGDNHVMNMKVEWSPYTPGDFRAYLSRDGQQVSNEVPFNMSADPMIYAHIECVSE